MQLQVVYDETGKIIATLHLQAEQRSAAAPRPVLRARAGQHLAVLDVPAELRHLPPQALHQALRVEQHGGAPRLVATKTKA